MKKELSQEQINAALQGISIPPQPQILVDIHMEQASPNPDINRIANLIAQDVGLSGSILKVVNSDYFGLEQKLTSIRGAVEVLGLNSVVNIVNGLSIKSELSDETIIAMGRFWDTAMDIANVSTHIAQVIHYAAPDLAYSLGLFHNCGVALLMQQNSNFLAVMEAAYADPESRIVDLENSQFKTNHAVLGYYVAKSWKLPADLCEVIAEHHNVREIFNSPQRPHYNHTKKTLLSILKMSEHIACAYQVLGGQDEDYEWDEISKNVLAYVGLSPDDFDEIKENIRDMGLIGSLNSAV